MCPALAKAKKKLRLSDVVRQCYFKYLELWMIISMLNIAGSHLNFVVEHFFFIDRLQVWLIYAFWWRSKQRDVFIWTLEFYSFEAY